LPKSRPTSELRDELSDLFWAITVFDEQSFGLLRVVVALGKIAFDAYLTILRDRGVIGSRSAFVFAHNALYRIGPGHHLLISSYHPSQQNTSTGKLTEQMLLDVFRRAKRVI